MERVFKSVMGLDLSLTGTGVCVIDEEGFFHTGKIGYSLRASKKDGVKKMVSEVRKVLRLEEISDFVIKFGKTGGVTCIGIEGMAFRGLGLNLLGELHGIIKYRCYKEMGIYPVSIPCRSVRNYLLGKAPGASVKAKAAVKEFFETKHGLKVETFDESDAAAVARVMWDWVNKKRVELSTREIDVVCRIDAALEGACEGN